MADEEKKEKKVIVNEDQNSKEYSEEEVRKIFRNPKTFILHTSAELGKNTIHITTAEEKYGRTCLGIIQKQFNLHELDQKYYEKNAECTKLREELKKQEGKESDLEQNVRLEKKLENKIEETKNTILANTPPSWHNWLNNLFALIMMIAVPIASFLGVVAKKREKDKEEMKKNLDDLLAKAKQGINMRHTPKKYLEEEKD